MPIIICIVLLVITRLYSNRCICYHNLKEYDIALKDADESIRCNNKWWKSHYRKASIYMDLKMFFLSYYLGT